MDTNATAIQTFITIDGWVRRYPDAFYLYMASLSEADQAYTKAFLYRLSDTLDFDAEAADIEVLCNGLRDTILNMQVEKILK